MLHLHWSGRKSAVAISVFALGLVAAGVSAQGDGGGPGGGPGGPPPGPPPTGGPGGFHRPMGPPRPVTGLDIPLSVLQKTLTLTPDESTQIQKIQRDFRETRHQLMPPPGDDGAPPDPAAIKASRDKIKAASAAAETQLEAVLTADQKDELASLVRDTNDFRDVAIPPGVASTLQLTPDQKQSIDAAAVKERADFAALGVLDPPDQDPAVQTKMDAIRKTAHEAAMASLTDAQKAQVEKFMQANPGGPGGRGHGHRPDGGGPGNDGPGGPPPGGGGPGSDRPAGPPPADDGGGPPPMQN